MKFPFFKTAVPALTLALIWALPSVSAPVAPAQNTEPTTVSLPLALGNWSGKIPGEKKAVGFEISDTAPEPHNVPAIKWDLWKVSAINYLPPTAPADWSGYSYLNFWMYCEAASEIPLRISVICGHEGLLPGLRAVGPRRLETGFGAF